MSVYIEDLVQEEIDRSVGVDARGMGVGDLVGGTLCIRVGSPSTTVSSTDLTLDTQPTDLTLELAGLEYTLEEDEDFVDSEDEVRTGLE